MLGLYLGKITYTDLKFAPLLKSDYTQASGARRSTAAQSLERRVILRTRFGRRKNYQSESSGSCREPKREGTKCQEAKAKNGNFKTLPHLANWTLFDTLATNHALLRNSFSLENFTIERVSWAALDVIGTVIVGTPTNR
jgi:hypothetical protein